MLYEVRYAGGHIVFKGIESIKGTANPVIGILI